MGLFPWLSSKRHHIIPQMLMHFTVQPTDWPIVYLQKVVKALGLREEGTRIDPHTGNNEEREKEREMDGKKKKK